MFMELVLGGKLLVMEKVGVLGGHLAMSPFSQKKSAMSTGKNREICELVKTFVVAKHQMT